MLREIQQNKISNKPLNKIDSSNVSKDGKTDVDTVCMKYSNKTNTATAVIDDLTSSEA